MGLTIEQGMELASGVVLVHPYISIGTDPVMVRRSNDGSNIYTVTGMARVYKDKEAHRLHRPLIYQIPLTTNVTAANIGEMKPYKELYRVLYAMFPGASEC